MFALCYATEGGFNYQAIESMSSRDRRWYLKRLRKQLDAEMDALKKGNKGRKR